MELVKNDFYKAQIVHIAIIEPYFLAIMKVYLELIDVSEYQSSVYLHILL